MRLADLLDVASIRSPLAERPPAELGAHADIAVGQTLLDERFEDFDPTEVGWPAAAARVETDSGRHVLVASVVEERPSLEWSLPVRPGELPPSTHGVLGFVPTTPLPEHMTTIAERFRDEGWNTRAIAYEPPLYEGGFEQGFDV